MLLYGSVFDWREYVYVLALVQLLLLSPSSLQLLLCIAQKAMPTLKKGGMTLSKSHKQEWDLLSSPLLTFLQGGGG
jgi:hypothetical protein